MPRVLEDMYQPVTIRNTAMADHISMFTTHHLKFYAKETSKVYTKALRSFLSFILEDRNFKFRLADFERYTRYLDQQKHLSPATISTYLTALRAFCEYLVEQKELPRNPAKRVHGISTPKKLPTYFTHDELQSLMHVGDLPTLMDLRDIAIMHLLLAGFLSEQEIHQAQVRDISESGHIMLQKGKNFSIPQSAIHSLQAYLSMRFNENGPHFENPLFESLSNRTKGQAMSIRGIRDALHQRLIKADISEERISLLSAYTFRHTGGCLLAIANLNEEQIMKRMRLKSKTTALQYLQLKQEAIDAGLEKSLHLLG